MKTKFPATRPLATGLLVMAGLLAMYACKNDDPSPVTKTSQVIGQTGGTLAANDGVLSLVLPEGAVAENTTVSIQKTEEVAPNGIGRVYTLSPEGTQFDKPVKLSFHYTDADVANTPVASMAIAYKKADNTWQVMPTVASNAADKSITTETTHFSQWTLLEVPTISGFAPQSGAVGTMITISGNNFSSITSENNVTFNGKAATVISSAANALTVKVPAGASSGKIIVTTVFGGLNYTVVSENEFTVESNEPVMTGFAPSTGGAGTLVTISGGNFSSLVADNHATFNGKDAIVMSASTTALVVKVPVGATSGKIIIITSFGGQPYTVVSATDFTVENNEPAIAGFAPASGAVGALVTINGSNFSANVSDNHVSFNGTAAVVMSSSATQLVAIVPAGATTGKVMVLTMYQGLNWTIVSTGDFTVTP